MWVGNLEYSVSQQEIEAHFAQCGAVADVRLPTDAQTGRNKGFAFVRFESNDAATLAKLELDGTELGSRLIKVALALSKGKPRSDAAPSERERKHSPPRGLDRDARRDRIASGGRGVRSSPPRRNNRSRSRSAEKSPRRSGRDEPSKKRSRSRSRDRDRDKHAKKRSRSRDRGKYERTKKRSRSRSRSHSRSRDRRERSRERKWRESSPLRDFAGREVRTSETQRSRATDDR